MPPETTSCWSVAQSCPTVRPHELQHTRVPCPLPSPRVCSNSCSWSWWCLLTISSCHPLLLLPSIFPSIRVFSNELALYIRWPKYWSLSFSISPSNEYSELISFRIDWFDLLAVQRTLKSSFSSTIAWRHQFFSAQSSLRSMLTSIYDYWKNHSFDCANLCRQTAVSAF